MHNAYLSILYPPSELESLLSPAAGWHPYPPARDRASWESLPMEQRQDILTLGEEALAAPWPSLPATLYLRFARDGDRSAFEAPYFQRRRLLANLVLAECVEGRGKIVDAIAEAVWSICEESSWCLPAHISVQKAGAGLPDTGEPIVDLFAAETSALLSWTHYLVASQLAQVSPLLPMRMASEIQARILTPAMQRDDFWWMGFSEREVNNWNPWINANWLASVLLIETDGPRRIASVAKIMRSLDRFITPYPEDGGCDEGPGYWTRAGASLFDCLELLFCASGGKINCYNNPKIQNIGRYIYRAHIAGDYYVNFADAPAILSPDASLVSGYGERIQDQAMLAMGAWLAERPVEASHPKDLGHDLTRALRRVAFPHPDSPDKAMAVKTVAPGSGGAPLQRDAYLPDIQFFAARDRSGISTGLYLAAKGGHNAESHNHNDVGHFIVYYDGKPLIIDVGVETYTRKTFGPQRYEIWTMQSAYHSLPTIDGIMQAPGREFAAREVRYTNRDECAALELDLAPAYPPQAHLASWKRTLELERGKQVVLTEQYEFEQAPASLTLSLITPSKVGLSIPGILRLDEAALAHDRLSASGEISFTPHDFTVSVEAIPIRDDRLGGTWGGQLNRILFNANSPGKQGQWIVCIRGKM